MATRGFQATTRTSAGNGSPWSRKVRRGCREEERVLSMPSLDIRSDDGRLIADIMASFAAHERRRIRQRGGTSAGDRG